MLIGYGGYGQEMPTIPDLNLPQLPGEVHAGAIANLGPQVGDQRCEVQNGETYCLSKQSYLRRNMAIAGGVGLAAGVVVMMLIK